ncbi:hypothetical protein P170DRAFT_510465 [Aspergillus steynii IBT 23096]|uniref:SMP-30/Gluconolactonase/LRE-like region domain-containing protein n=1 Tax=Aspergillus steynii IBT 23096 TaxID=1392250 RepID=A0A2I2G479_9EURO|nr:uncharacterized protein P170DRAFT_510465 [Aspergillus steynii IBT 23096]PLB47690.1 hypothetical protein P170DRAFT_510465 [Aspergillus steynii IBT 23096]
MVLSKIFALALAFAPALAVPSVPSAAVNKTHTVFQYRNNGTWLENILVRNNGDILTTRLDVPELWAVDPTGTRNASLLQTFPNVRSLLGITEIDRDIYALVAGNFSIQTLSTPGTYSIWKVDLSTSAKPHTSIIAHIPEADFLNGLAKFDKDTLLTTDSAKGVIWRVDIPSGNYSIAMSDPATMKSPRNSPKPVGVNGIKVLGTHVYYSSSTGMHLARVPFTRHAAPAGPVEIVAGGFTPDDFVLASNGTAYVTTNAENGLLKVEPSGRVTLVAGNLFTTELAGATSVAFSRDQKTLYVATAGGQFQPVLGDIIEPAKIVAVSI